MVEILGQNVRRGTRRPQHTFNLRHSPYTIQPFFLAPVLPGETLEKLFLQVRTVTDPIKNPIIGWWLEYHFFYVKMRDLISSGVDGADSGISATLQNMILQPGYNVSAHVATSTSTNYYSADGGLLLTYACYRRVVETYFRSGDEHWDDGNLSSMSLAHVKNAPGWTDSLAPGAVDVADDIELLDISAGTAGGGDDKLMASEVDLAMRQWKLLTMQGLTNQTFDEYLATFGVRRPQEDLHMPEHLRAIVNWQYPSNTIDPTNGTPRSAVSWSIRESADKNRYFREPGFLFGVTICRPKTYFSRQLGSFTEFLNDAYKWAPAVLLDSRLSGYASYSDTADAPLDPAVISAAWSADARDLFFYGDQFLNGSLAATDRNLVALPSADVTNKRYVAQTDIDGLFVTATAGNMDVNHDGVVSMAIKTMLPSDYSPDGGGMGGAVVS